MRWVYATAIIVFGLLVLTGLAGLQPQPQPAQPPAQPRPLDLAPFFATPRVEPTANWLAPLMATPRSYGR